MTLEKLKILIVDDSTVHRKKIQMCLDADNYDLTLCQSGEEAVEMFEKTRYDLITLDLNMKGMSGIETCRELRLVEEKQYTQTHCPIIFVTSVDDVEVRIKCFEVGGDDFVEKSDIDGIIHKVNAFLAPELVWEGFKILVVEDSRVTRKFLKYILKGRGADVAFCSNGIEAYETLKQDKHFDLVLTDQIMPELTGVELLKKIRQDLGLSIPVILASGSSHKDVILNFYKSGGNDYTSKPFIKEEMVAKVNALLKTRIQNRLLKKHLSDLENANRIKDQFLAVCSHDLRTPLNTIIGLSDLLSEGVEEEEGIAYSKKVNKSANELLEMVNSLLDLSEVHLKGKSIEFANLNLFEIINESYQHLRVINDKNIALLISAEREDILISANKVMLMRAFNNLLSNAYKFTHSGGEIKTVIKSIDDGRVELTIKDSGIGIPPEMIDKLFDQLSGIGRKGLQGERSVGLGMNIVKNILDDHGVQISVTSEIGEGTTFCLSFEEVREGP